MGNNVRLSQSYVMVLTRLSIGPPLTTAGNFMARLQVVRQELLISNFLGYYKFNPPTLCSDIISLLRFLIDDMVFFSASPTSDNNFLRRWASRMAFLCAFIPFLKYLDSIRVRYSLLSASSNLTRLFLAAKFLHIRARLPPRSCKSCHCCVPRE